MVKPVKTTYTNSNTNQTYKYTCKIPNMLVNSKWKTNKLELIT